MQPEEHAASSFPTCRVSGYKPTRGSKYWTCKFSLFKGISWQPSWAPQADVCVGVRLIAVCITALATKTRCLDATQHNRLHHQALTIKTCLWQKLLSSEGRSAMPGVLCCVFIQSQARILKASQTRNVCCLLPSLLQEETFPLCSGNDVSLSTALWNTSFK